MVLHLSVRLIGPRGSQEDEDPRAADQIGARSPSRWGDAGRSRAPARSPISCPDLSPRDAHGAVGGIRVGDTNPGRRASPLTTVLPITAPDGPAHISFDRLVGRGEERGPTVRIKDTRPGSQGAESSGLDTTAGPRRSTTSERLLGIGELPIGSSAFVPERSLATGRSTGRAHADPCSGE